MSLRQLNLCVSNGLKILLQRLLVLPGELLSQRSCIGYKQVQGALASCQFCSSVLATGHKEQIENLFWFVHRWNGTSFTIKGLSLRTARATDATVGRHHQGRVASKFSHVRRIDLVNRNRILVRPVASRCRTCQVLIGIGVSMNSSDSRVRQPGVNRDFTS